MEENIFNKLKCLVKGHEKFVPDSPISESLEGYEAIYIAGQSKEVTINVCSRCGKVYSTFKRIKRGD